MNAGTRNAPSSQRAVYLAIVASVIAFILLPLVMAVWVAFFSNRIMSFPPEGYTLVWFGSAWTSEAFRQGFILSIEIALIAAGAALLLGVPAALAVARYRFPGREAVNTILTSPIMIPAIVAGSAIYLFYIDVQGATGVQLAGTVPGLVFAHTLIAIPWVLRLVTASLTGFGTAVEEASSGLGASQLTTFFRVTLPIIKPGIVAGGLFGFIASFGDLEKSLLLVGPGKNTLPIAMFNYLQYRTDPTIMAVATIQIVIVGAALVISDRYVRLSRTF